MGVNVKRWRAGMDVNCVGCQYAVYTTKLCKKSEITLPMVLRSHQRSYVLTSSFVCMVPPNNPNSKLYIILSFLSRKVIVHRHGRLSHSSSYLSGLGKSWVRRKRKSYCRMLYYFLCKLEFIQRVGERFTWQGSKINKKTKNYIFWES